MAMTMQQFIRLADPDLDEIWHENEPQYEEQYSRVFNVKSMDQLYRIEAEMAGFGPMAEIAEGAEVQYDEAIAPRERRYDFVTRGKGYKVTRKLWENDRYDEVKQFERDLRRADMDDTETFYFALLANATGTTISTGFDGLALASTAHTRLDGGAVQANRPTSLVALSLTALEDAAIAFTKFKDHRGRPFRSQPRDLVIPLDLVLTANEILASAMNPTTTNNATNSLKNVFSISPLVTPYITSTTYWALMGDQHDVNAIWRNRPFQKNETEFDTQTIKRASWKDMARGHGRWYGYYQGQT
jgi:hypothetical protein